MKKILYSIRGKILIPFLLISLLFFTLTQTVLSIYLTGVFSSQLDLQLKQNTHTMHNLLQISFEDSIRNYLKGLNQQNLSMMGSLHQSVLDGTISLDEAQMQARQLLSSMKIGPQGYSYICDYQGIIIEHPTIELIGTPSIFHDLYSSRVNQKAEYTEYIYEGRQKVLYRDSFLPWHWIIASTAYKNDFTSLMDMNRLSRIFWENITLGSSFIVDNEARFVIEPQHYHEDLAGILAENIPNIKRDSPVVELEWGKGRQRQRMYLTWLEDFHWYIGSSISVQRLYQPVYTLTFILSIISLIYYLILFTLLFLIIRRFTIPLEALTLRLLEENGKTLDHVSEKKDEIEILDQVFSHFLDRLRIEEMRSAKANKENRILAQFPHELQFPLIRLDSQKRVKYLNKAAQQCQDEFLDSSGQHLKEELAHPMQAALKDGNALDMQIGEKSYRIIGTSIAETQEVYLHFYDETMLRNYETLQSIWGNVFDTSQEGIFVTDPKGYIEQVNASFCRITGYSPREIIGKNVEILIAEDHDSALLEDIYLKIKDQGRWQGEFWSKKKNGESFQQWLSVSRFRDSHSGIYKIMAIFHDMSDLQEKQKQIDHIYQHDILTDLPNRYTFYEKLERGIKQCNSQEMLAVMLLDVDNYNIITNYLGNKTGDLFLQQISRFFQDALRSKDLIARLGTAEFAILLSGLQDISSCFHLISRIQNRLDRNLNLEGQNITPLVNIGISLYPADGSTPDLLIRRVRLAMHNARSQRRGSYEFFDITMEEGHQLRFRVESSLKKGLEQREFQVYYQPKATFENGYLTGFEALIRWIRPGKPQLSPTEFIPLLEENGLIVEVGEWIISETCRFVKQLQALDSSPFKIAINVSARQIASPTFSDHLLLILRDHQVSPEYIELEITENIAALDIEGVVNTLQSLRDWGFSIALDDFGTGYSSLSYLRELPFDCVKIDRSFIKPLEESASSLAIVRSIITLAKTMNKKTVAEGIETPAQAEICRKEGCNLMQGYLLSPPLTDQDALAFFKQSRS